MATNKIITVTTIPTRTGDSVASYNAYSNIDGLLGAMTPGEAAAGKTFALSDGSSHNVTVKTVWTTAGESTSNVSNVVVVNLINLAFTLSADLVEETSGQYRNQTNVSWTTSYGVTTTAILGSGDFVYQVDMDDKTKQSPGMIGLSSHGNHVPFNDATTDWDWAAYAIASDDHIKVRVGGSWVNDDSSTIWSYTAGDKLSFRRISGTLYLYQNDTEIHNFGTYSGDIYGHIAAPSNSGAGTGYISNPAKV